MRTWLVVFALCVGLAACGDETPSSNNDSNANDFNLSQNDDNASNDNAANDNDNDLNNDLGTECPDPDADDVLLYSEHSDVCAYFDDHAFLCGEGQEPFNSDVCGCGCILDEGSYTDCDIDDCPEGTYCNHGDGQCGADGGQSECLAKTVECTDDVAEVCGCDGEFRVGSSSCAAQHDGVDSTSPAHCLPDDCPDPNDDDVTYTGYTDEYCGEDSPPINCADDEVAFDDECGCGCMARQDDIDPPPGECEIDDCPQGYYCHYDDGVCGEDGATGSCEPNPQPCTGDFGEVCGCDGEIYNGSSTCAPQHQGGVDQHSDADFCN